MKVARHYGAGQPLVIETADDPAPRTGEAVIRVAHCGVCGTDLHLTEQHPEEGGVVLGHEFTGEIVALAPDAPAGWREGDRLCALPFFGCGSCLPCLQGKTWLCAARKVVGSADLPGGFAQYIRVHLNEAILLPGEVDWQEGALVEPLAVALHAVRRVRGGLSGKNVLVVGAGPIGLATALWAGFFGARHVIVSELDAGRGKMALAHGATGLIDAREDLAQQFLDTAGAAPDLIFECVGVPGMIAKCIDAAPYGAEVVVVGFCMQPDNFQPAAAMVKELTVTFAIAHDKSDFQLVVDMIASRRIDISGLITGVHGFEAFPAAFEALRKPTNQCKILLDPWAA